MSHHLSLHDCLSLGEIALGLQNDDKANTTKQEASHHDRSIQEIHRLPLFLRILSMTRPLSTITSLPSSEKREESEQIEQNNEEVEEKDDLVDQVVERLEQVAATYSVAEGVDVVTSHLAPTLCRKISKLKRLKAPKGNGIWDTSELAAVARNPKSSSKKRRRRSPSLSTGEDTNGLDVDAIHQSSSSEEDNDAMDIDLNETESPNKRQKVDGKPQDPAAVIADQDSTESTFLKTLSELASLVVASLAPIERINVESNEATDEQHQDQNESSGGKIALTIDDSILSEASRIGVDAEGVNIGGGAMEGSDLGSTVTAIMFNAPVLQSRHVAHALCRSATPQVADLMTRMGSNCPPSVPSLLIGCIDAYLLATKNGCNNTSIIKATKEGVRALAKLSFSEKARVQNKLQSLDIMVDVQLQLGMELSSSSSSAITVSCILIKYLSKELVVKKETDQDSRESKIGTYSKEIPHEEEPRPNLKNADQSTGDSSFGFRYSNSIRNVGRDNVKLSMVQALVADSMDLYQKALTFFAQEFSSTIESAEENGTSVANGKTHLLVKAYCWLLLVPIDALSLNQDFEMLLPLARNVCQQLDRLVKTLTNHVEKSKAAGKETPKASHLDRVVVLLQASVTLTVAQMLPSASPSTRKDILGQIKNTLIQIKELSKIVSIKAHDFCLKINDAISSANTSHLWFLLARDVFELQREAVNQPPFLNDCLHSIDKGIKILSKNAFLLDMIGDNSSQNITMDLISKASLLLLEMDRSYHSIHENNDGISKQVKETLECILTTTPNRVSHSHMIESGDVSKFVVSATAFLSAQGNFQVPLIMAPQLEVMGTRQRFLYNDKIDSAIRFDNSTSLFLLLLLHAFEYLKQNPKSPFTFDARAIPMKEALTTSEALRSSSNNHFMCAQLKAYAERFCPETLARLSDTALELPHNNFGGSKLDSFTRHETLSLLSSAIQFCVERTKLGKHDIDATSTEKVFLKAKARLSDADLCCTVVSSLLACPHKPPPSYTYSLLCRDPLVLLKCPMKIWKCAGLRRIALTILVLLLESNAVIVMNDSPSGESAEELLASRDAVVVRCLLTIMIESETDALPFSYCSMTTSVIRLILRQRYGVVALMVKQGLSERAIDWMTEFVPETMNDSLAMIQMLSDRRSLAPSERLVAADAVLRIAIVQGHSNEADAADMAYTALSILVDTFFLILGPVGVPVNALLVDDSELDVTQISRKAAFRILRSLLKVRGRRKRLRKECVMALHKIANLCKHESVGAGVAGAVAGRRKTLLKEIFDAVSKSANAMGSPIGSQTSTA